MKVKSSDLIGPSEIQIGEQTWLTANLSVTNFRNGEKIDEAKTKDEWEKAGEEKKPCWCYYDNDILNGRKYGILYNWYAVNDARGLAPEGWHIPSEMEWQKLIKYLGIDNAGEMLRANSRTKDFIGLSVLLGGVRFSDFSFLDENCYLWTSQTASTPNAISRVISRSSKKVRSWVAPKLCGMYVRCLKGDKIVWI